MQWDRRVPVRAELVDRLQSLPEIHAGRHTLSSEFSVDNISVRDLPRVEIIYSYANLGGELIDCLVQQGVRGLVLAGVGDGNTTDAALAALGKAAGKGVAVVRSSRVGSGVRTLPPSTPHACHTARITSGSSTPRQGHARAARETATVDEDAVAALMNGLPAFPPPTA